MSNLHISPASLVFSVIQGATFWLGFPVQSLGFNLDSTNNCGKRHHYQTTIFNLSFKKHIYIYILFGNVLFISKHPFMLNQKKTLYCNTERDFNVYAVTYHFLTYIYIHSMHQLTIKIPVCRNSFNKSLYAHNWDHKV